MYITGEQIFMVAVKSGKIVQFYDSFKGPFTNDVS